MGKRALIILGAGASADLISRSVGRKVNKQFRPPVTSELFDQRFSAILDRYPRARSLAPVVLDRLSNDEALEAILRDLAGSTNQHTSRQFREIPLYLQELLWQVSKNYCSEAVNYSLLVNRFLASDFERVAFVTLNYDTLLDGALGTIDVGGRIIDMAGYIRKRWMLIKPHGSVDWGRLLQTSEGLRVDLQEAHHLRLQAETRGESPSAEYLAAEVPNVLSFLRENIEMIDGDPDRSPKVAEDFYYPAMTIPVEGKAGFSCPPEHVYALEEFLPTCKNVLIIGVSGKDEDLLGQLTAHLPPCTTVSFVDRTESATRDVACRFREVPQLAAASNIGGRYGEGFSSFVQTGGLATFARVAV